MPWSTLMPKAEAWNDEFTALAEQLLRGRLQGRYALQDASAAAKPGTLVVNIHVFIHYGNRGLRYAGVGGTGGVDSTLTAVDAASGEVQLRAHSLSDLTMGLFGGDMKSTIRDNLRKLMSDSGL